MSVPAQPTLVYPRRILEHPQPPDGPRQWLTPLAFVRWHRAVARGRGLRAPLRQPGPGEEHSGGSCTVRVPPEDVGGGWALQDVIDAHAGRDRSTTICLEPGDYVLPQPLRIERRHGRADDQSDAAGCGAAR